VDGRLGAVAPVWPGHNTHAEMVDSWRHLFQLSVVKTHFVAKMSVTPKHELIAPKPNTFNTKIQLAKS
jgi:hypothetical protein